MRTAVPQAKRSFKSKIFQDNSSCQFEENFQGESVKNTIKSGSINHSYDSSSQKASPTTSAQKTKTQQTLNSSHISLDQYLRDANLPTVSETISSAVRRSATLKVTMKKSLEKKRAQSVNAKKRDRTDQFSKAQHLIKQKMFMKNMVIKQRAVNETPPMIGFNS